VAAALPPPAPAERRPWRTAADRSYADSFCADPVLLETGRRLTVIGDPAVSDTTADLTLTLRSGEKFRLTHDLVARVGVDELARGLRAKAAALLDQAYGRSPLGRDERARRSGSPRSRRAFEGVIRRLGARLYKLGRGPAPAAD
jgi:hypothetical protein